jgi:hypothetical protein
MYTRPEGRFDRSLRLLEVAWGYLWKRPRLLALPAIGTLCLIVAAAAIYLPFFALIPDWDAKVETALATALLSVPLTFITTTFNVAFLAMVLAYERGEEPSVGYGLRVARARMRTIIGWTLLSSGVGGALSALQRAPGGDWLANVVGFLGGVAWGLATFFVVPVLVLEDVGPVEAVRRSARAFKERWGEAIVGDVAIGFAVMFAMIPGVVAFLVGAYGVQDGSDVWAPIVLTIGIVLTAPVLVFSSAVTELFVLALYREGATGPFSADDLRDGVTIKAKKKRRWLWL